MASAQGQGSEPVVVRQGLYLRHQGLAIGGLEVAEKMLLVGVGQRGQGGHQAFAGRREHQHLFACTVLGQAALGQALGFEPREDLGGRALGHAQGLDQRGVAGLRLGVKRAQRHPFAHRHLMPGQQLGKTGRDVVGDRT